MFPKTKFNYITNYTIINYSFNKHKQLENLPKNHQGLGDEERKISQIHLKFAKTPIWAQYYEHIT